MFEGDELVGLLGEQQTSVRAIVRSTVRLRSEGTLEEGEHRLSARFEVPSDAPAWYLGVRCTVRYQVRIHVSIPWWPDLRETYELLVEPHPSVRPKPHPADAKSLTPNGDPFVELSIAENVVRAGRRGDGRVRGGANVPRDACEGVEISLVAIEEARGDHFTFRSEQLRHNVPIVFSVPRGGARCRSASASRRTPYPR